MTRRPPYDSDHPVAWENYVVVLLTQSMLGMLSEDMERVMCRIGPDKIELDFYANGDVAEDVENISDDLEVYLATGSISIVSTIHDAPGDYRPDFSDRSLRCVFLAKRKI